MNEPDAGSCVETCVQGAFKIRGREAGIAVDEPVAADRFHDLVHKRSRPTDPIALVPRQKTEILLSVTT
jgi:hypothetical protein